MTDRPVFTDRGTGPPVLLLHGQPGSGQDWDPVADLLASDHRVLVPDRPGYGDSPGPASGPTGNARAMAALLEEAGGAPATVVGYSYGATVALRMAQLHPGAVAGLVLLCPAADARALGPGDRLLALPLVGDLLAHGAMRGAGRLLALIGDGRRSLGPLGPLARLAPVPLARFAASSARWRTGEDWRSFVVEQRALLAEMPDVTRSLGQVTAPAIVLAGRRDWVVRPAAIRGLNDALPDATVVWVPNAGHLLLWEEPELVAATAARMARRAQEKRTR